VARSLLGLPFSHAKVSALRQRLEPLAAGEVIAACEGSEAAEAWAIRDKHFDKAKNQVMASLATLASDRAWKLREQWLAEIGDDLGRDYEDARIACKSIVGLDDDRAWAIRSAARSIAPVAALASVQGLLGPRSFNLREENLSRAPKVVMATLRRADEPRAWQMRKAVAADCKEAIDSIDSLDGAEAWQLREQCADIWPSTVVKTLGPLADSERGQALIRRQLQRYPGNVSLLKHVSAMFLGLHRAKFQREELAP
jgi:dTMP kinase